MGRLFQEVRIKIIPKKNRSKGQCELVTPGAWNSIDCGNAICPAKKCDLNHMLTGNNFISFDGSEIKGECIEVKLFNSKRVEKAPNENSNIPRSKMATKILGDFGAIPMQTEFLMKMRNSFLTIHQKMISKSVQGKIQIDIESTVFDYRFVDGFNSHLTSWYSSAKRF